jgi:hypothetical protein
MREVRVSIKNFLFIKLSTNKAKSLPEACHPKVSKSTSRRKPPIKPLG